MKKTKLCCVIFLMTVVGFTASSISKGEENPQNSVSVKGSAVVSAQPDTIYITLYVSGDGILSEDAAKNAGAKSDEIKNALTKAFPKLKQITAVPLKLGEKGSRMYRSDESAQSPRPEVVNRFTITIDAASANDVPKIIDTALRAGAVLQLLSSSQYAGDLGSVVRYGVADAKKLENDARSKALSDAKEKASELAKLSGRIVGEIISIGDEPSTVYDYDGVRASRGKLPTKYVSFSNEPIEITSNLRVTFELKK